jgi:AcrR family transcriptional regulator
MNTRQQIIDATERIIQAKGIARATTKEIAREAGYAEGTLYKHFESKEDLFLSALQQHLPSFIEALGESVAGQGTPRANLEQIAQAAIDYYDRLIPLATAFFADADLLVRYRQALAQANAGPQRTHERVACYIEEEQRLGRIDKGLEPFYIAALLLGSCFQYAFIRHFVGTQPFTMSDEQFVAGTVQALLAGITPCQG